MRKTNYFLAFLIIGSSLYSCKNDSESVEIETEEISFKKEGELYLLRSNGDTIKKLDIEIADTGYERETGLMYRDGMDENQGMLFIYDLEAPRSFYMRNTYFSLDIIYFDRNKTSVSIVENAEPMNETSLPSEKPAQYILEVNAGKTAEWDFAVGDKFLYSRID